MPGEGQSIDVQAAPHRLPFPVYHALPVFNVAAAPYNGLGQGAATAQRDTLAVLQAVRDAEGSGIGGIILIPPGRWALGSIPVHESQPTYGSYNRIHIQGAGRGLTIIEPTATKTFDVGDAAHPTSGFALSDMTFRLTSRLGYANGLVRLRYLKGWRVENVELLGGDADALPFSTLYDYSAYLLELDTSYQGEVINCEANGYRTYLFEMNSIALPAEQKDTVLFTIPKATYCCAIGFVRAPGAGDWHGITWLNEKHVVDNAQFPEARHSDESSVAVLANAGAFAVTLVDGTNFSNSGFVVLGQGSNCELVEVINKAGNVLTLHASTPLRFSHPVGDYALRGLIGISHGSQVFNVTHQNPHYEVGACGILSAGDRGTLVIGAFASSQDVVRIVDPNTQDVHLIGGAHSGQTDATSGLKKQNMVRVTTRGDGGNLTRIRLEGQFIDPNALTIPVPYVNDVGGDRWRQEVGCTDPATNTVRSIDRVPFGGGEASTYEGWEGGTMTYQRTQKGSARAKRFTLLGTTFKAPMGGVGADRGDANVTLTVGTDSPTQRFATALTANRTVTLSTTNAENGDRFRVARTGAGAFNLDVGGLKTLAAANTWADVEYDGAAWRLTADGTL